MKLDPVLAILAASAILTQTTHGSYAGLQLPLLRLPYGTWRASEYNAAEDFYTFRNIRYAAPPVGPRRFAKPQLPQPVLGIQDGSVGHMCPQGNGSTTIGLPAQNEDCLFLDLRVPAKSLLGTKKKTSVVFYVHGGGYEAGSKNDPLILGGVDFLDPTGLFAKTDDDIIVVSINYRLGALGWLNGKAAQAAKASNLGLHDQRAALEWVRKYIGLVGGDPQDVSAWGYSAGSGSLIHHITQYDGRRDPLFRKAVIQSPGWFADWDAKAVDKSLQDFISQLGCAGKSFDCLRTADLKKILEASTSLKTVGPLPDGDWIKSAPLLAFKYGNYWKGLESVMATHVLLEFPASLNDTSDAGFRAAMFALFKDDDTVRRVEQQYPSPNTAGSPFISNIARLGAIQSDYTFVMNAMSVARAYAGRSYAGVYSIPGATHGSDASVPFFNPQLKYVYPGFPKPLLAGAYQSYFGSHARAGDVNTYRDRFTTKEWPRFTGDYRAKSINITEAGFEVITDSRAISATDFWSDVYAHLQAVVARNSSVEAPYR